MNASQNVNVESGDVRTERKGDDGLFEEVFEHSSDLAVLMEPTGLVLDANGSAIELCDLKREDVVGEMLWETSWFQSADGTRHQIKEDVQRAIGGTSPDRELEIQCGSETVVLDASIQPLAPGEDVEYLLFMAHDVTEYRRRITELERQNERLDEFASVVAHDIRNPLAVATGNLALASERVDLPELDTAEGSLERIQEILEDLLTVAREGKRVDERTEVKLAIAANEAWKHVDTASATLTIDSSTDVEADRRRLMQVFENLFRNAVEHGGEGVTVSVGTLEDGFYVEDDGPGFSDVNEKEIFEAGVTTTADGTGFGLSIVETIVLAHGWTIEATEGRESGARFEIRT